MQGNLLTDSYAACDNLANVVLVLVTIGLMNVVVTAPVMQNSMNSRQAKLEMAVLAKCRRKLSCEVAWAVSCRRPNLHALHIESDTTWPDSGHDMQTC